MSTLANRLVSDIDVPRLTHSLWGQQTGSRLGPCEQSNCGISGSGWQGKKPSVFWTWRIMSMGGHTKHVNVGRGLG